MENGSIREIVLGFKNVIDNIPTYCDNFDEAFDKLYEAFCLTMNELLPMKHFAITESKFGRQELNVFDSSEFCKDWVRETNELCAVDGITAKEIPFSEFIKLAEDDWDELNSYSCEFDRVVVSVN